MSEAIDQRTAFCYTLKDRSELVKELKKQGASYEVINKKYAKREGFPTDVFIVITDRVIDLPNVEWYLL